MKFGCFIGILLNSADLVCRVADVSGGSLRFRDIESRLYVYVYMNIYAYACVNVNVSKYI